MLRSVVLTFLIFFAVATAEAAATLRIINHNDPAGDPTVIQYRLESPTWSSSPFPFELRDGGDRSFGVPAGTYTAQALVPAGWVVADIQCVGPRLADFVIDVPNGRVTMPHGTTDEQTCSFTNRKGGGPAPSRGVAPAPPPAEIPLVVLPRGPALLSVKARRGAARPKRRSASPAGRSSRGPCCSSARAPSAPRAWSATPAREPSGSRSTGSACGACGSAAWSG
jgi:hypothetical protein